jgi:hypothetical protein
MAPKCPLCNRVYIDPNCAIKLYQSENECAVCLTKGKTMMALPCGHQFCEEDIKKVGFRVLNSEQPPEPARAPPVIYRPMVPSTVRGIAARRAPPVIYRPMVPSIVRGIAARRDFQRNIQARRNPILVQRNARRTLNARRALFRRNRNRRKRCGWCGHIGHELRKCKIHERQCGCRTGCRTRRHISILNKKKKCTLCNKKGHRPATCSKIYIF